MTSSNEIRLTERVTASLSTGAISERSQSQVTGVEGEHLPACSVFTWNTSCGSDRVSETSFTDQGVSELYQVSLLSDNVLYSLFCGEMQFGVFLLWE